MHYLQSLRSSQLFDNSVLMDSHRINCRQWHVVMAKHDLPNVFMKEHGIIFKTVYSMRLC